MKIGDPAAQEAEELETPLPAAASGGDDEEDPSDDEDELSEKRRGT